MFKTNFKSISRDLESINYLKQVDTSEHTFYQVKFDSRAKNVKALQYGSNVTLSCQTDHNLYFFFAPHQEEYLLFKKN